MQNLENATWQSICSIDDLPLNVGVRALLEDEQVAIFNVKDILYAVSAMDPFTNAPVLSRGIVGDLNGDIVVASPIYKQHFVLENGRCLEDETVTIKTYPIRNNEGTIELAVV